MFCPLPLGDENNAGDSQQQQSMTNQPTINVDEFVAELSFWGQLPARPREAGRRSALEGGGSRIRNRQSRSRDSLSLSPTSSHGSPLASTPVWKTAVDRVSGRVYYYDAITRKTQWEKPKEVKEMEKRKKMEKRRQDRQFFRDMEQNIYNSLSRKEVIPGVSVDSPHVVAAEPHPRGRTVRTISGMDEALLQELKQEEEVVVKRRTKRDEHGRPPLPTRQSQTQTPLEFSPDQQERKTSDGTEADTMELRGEHLLDGPIDEELEMEEADLPQQQSPPPPQQQEQQQQHHVRRNTGGTIRFQSTMTNPNIEATIKCVCGVYRAHILQATGKRHSTSPVSVVSYPLDEIAEIFRDDYGGWRGRRRDTEEEVPSLVDIIAFYCDFYGRSKMEHDTIIMSLIYVERLIKETNGFIAPVPENWKSLLFSCMVLASKVWDDMSMWNIDFSNVCGRGRGKNQLASFTLERINQLELALLKSLNFNVKVRASEYAKYYFLIRSMLMKSGLLHENDDPLLTPPGTNYLKELNQSFPELSRQRHPTPPKRPKRTKKHQQQQQQQKSKKEKEKQNSASSSSNNNNNNNNRRSHSLSDYFWLNEDAARNGQSSQVCLEQLVSMNR